MEKVLSLAIVPTIACLALFIYAAAPQGSRHDLEETPIGTARQGGYVFNYQSGKGKGCRVYRLRNTPGGFLVPVRWYDEAETFIETNIPACASGSQCEWLEVDLLTGSSARIAQTSLGYGVNRDEFIDRPEAYRREDSHMASNEILGVRIFGVVAGSDGKPARLDLEVNSKIQNQSHVNYELVVGVFGPKGSSVPVKPVKPGSPEEKKGWTVVWKPVGRNEFFAGLDTAKPSTSMGYLGDRTLVYSLPDVLAPRAHVEQGNLTILSSGEPILEVSAPAYEASSTTH